MSISRRTFLKKGTIAMAGQAIIPGLLFASAKQEDRLGIQLYSVRNEMEKDPADTLKKIAEIGYNYVEHAGYEDRSFYGYSAKKFKNILDDIGLKMCSGHVYMDMSIWNKSKNDFTDSWKYTLEDAVTAGQEYLITPTLNKDFQKDYDRLMQLMDLFNRCGTLCKNFGLKFGYHNDYPFDVLLNGKRLYDIILAETDPVLVTQELDIGNMYGEIQHEDRTILDILEENRGRFPLMHVKDEFKITGKGEMSNGYESTVLGNGLVPIKSIIDYAKKHNHTHYFIIEQESYQDYSPLEGTKKNYAVMKKWGY